MGMYSPLEFVIKEQPGILEEHTSGQGAFILLC